jgi:hypothetical protein
MTILRVTGGRSDDADLIPWWGFATGTVCSFQQVLLAICCCLQLYTACMHELQLAALALVSPLAEGEKFILLHVLASALPVPDTSIDCQWPVAQVWPPQIGNPCTERRGACILMIIMMFLSHGTWPRACW